MRIARRLLFLAVFYMAGVLYACVSTAAAAAPAAGLLKAKKEAESKGYILETSHDDIVKKAKTRG